MQDIRKMADGFKAKSDKIRQLQKRIPRYIAGAAEKMKDANFSAEGFVINGSARPRWKKRKKENHLTRGRRILYGMGNLQNNVKSKALADRVSVGVDLSKVPYAKVHNEGGRLIQYVRAHTRKHWKTGKRYQVRAFSRKLNIPQRKYLGYSPDILKIVEKDIHHEFDKIFKS